MEGRNGGRGDAPLLGLIFGTLACGNIRRFKPNKSGVAANGHH